MGSSGSRLPVIGLAVAAGLIGYIAHLRGEITVLESQLAAVTQSNATAPVSDDETGAAASAGAARLAEGRTLSEQQRAAMINALSVGGYNAGSPVWFATIPDNPEATQFQKQLAAVFEEAGWIVKGNKPVSFRMKPGTYIFAADEVPPEYVSDVNSAFVVAGVPVAANGRGHRAYFGKRKAKNPDWIGFEMDGDQSFVLAVGRNPNG